MSNGYINIPGLESGGGGSGVSDLNGLTGSLNIVGGDGINVSPSGSNITIDSTSVSWKQPVADFASLPALGNDPGDARVTLDTSGVWIWDGAAWTMSSAADANAIYRDNSQPPTQDISWDSNALLDVTHIDSDAANPAASGILRLGNTEKIAWRDAANNEDLFIQADGSDRLQFSGIFGGNTPQIYATMESSSYSGSSVLTIPGASSLLTVNSFCTTAAPSTYNSGFHAAAGEQITFGTVALNQIYSGLYLQNSGTAFLHSDDYLSAVNSIQHGDPFALKADAGFLRLQNNDSISWRNFANNGNESLSLDTSDIFQLTNPLSIDGSITSSTFINSASTPATSGVVRLSNNQRINWRNAADSNDVGIRLDTNDVIQLGFGSVAQVQTMKAETFTTDSSNPADNGRVRLSNGDRLAWRNNASSADIYWIVDGTDRMVLTNAPLQLSSSLYQGATSTNSGFINIANDNNISWRNSGNSADINFTLNGSDIFSMGAGLSANGDVSATGDLKSSTAGKGLLIKEGSDAKMGVSSLVGGTVVVSNTSVTANSRILLTKQETGTPVAAGSVRISARTVGTDFTISSDNAIDTSDVAWMIVEPS